MSHIDVSLLLAALAASDADERLSAAQSLSQLGDKAAAAAVPLVKACADEDPNVREWVTTALEELGPPTQQDAPKLAELLQHENREVGYWAATLLGRLGPDAAPYAEHLVTALETHPHRTVRARAAWALGKIGSRAAGAVPPLQRVAGGPHARLATIASTAIRRIQR